MKWIVVVGGKERSSLPRKVCFPTWPQASGGGCYIRHTVDIVVQDRADLTGN